MIGEPAAHDRLLDADRDGADDDQMWRDDRADLLGLEPGWVTVWWQERAAAELAAYDDWHRDDDRYAA